MNFRVEKDLGSCFPAKKKFIDKPALVVELKWDRTAEGAINQIKEMSTAEV